MKRDYFYLALTIIFCLLIGLLSLKIINQKETINSIQKGEKNLGMESQIYQNLMTKVIEISNLPLAERFLLTNNRDSFRLKELLSSKKLLIIYLNKGVCVPCVERFMEIFNKYCKEIQIENFIIITEIANLRQVNLMVNKYQLPNHSFFIQENLFSKEVFIDKPCLFLLNNQMIPMNLFLYDDFLEEVLHEYLRRISETNNS
jgi:hypothetical protein